MKLATPGQMNEIDSFAINRIGIPGIVLMENAALRVVDEIDKSIGPLKGKNILVVAGKGNNGGDAFATARHLYNRGADIQVFVAAAKTGITADAGINLAILENMGVQVCEAEDGSRLEQLRMKMRAADLILDGIFGTGLKGEVKGVARSIIELINRSGKPVVSIDIPSGLSGETGKILGACVKASKTVTFGLPKVGLVIHPGCEYVGELIVADIGIPRSVVDSMGIKYNVTDEEYITEHIPLRKAESNKGDYGKILIIAGSRGMTGAGRLSAAAALRTGAGLVYLGVPASLSSIFNASLAEAVVIPLEDKGAGFLSEDCISHILERIRHASAIAVGPGLSSGRDITKIVGEILENSSVPVILDADALNAISKDIAVLAKHKAVCIVTPHPGEMARLVGMTIEDVQNDRMETALEFARKWDVITVLKGSKTVIAAPDGELYINTTGNPGMATAGSGDVLTGIIVGLVGQGLRPTDAAVTGVYLHGLAGDSAAEIKGEHGLVAGDMIEELPRVIKRFADRKKCRGGIISGL